MQLLISLLISFNLVSGLNTTEPSANNNTPEHTVVIEVLDAESIPFDFSMKYDERRKIIKIRSAEPIKSLRTVDTATKSHKGYNVMGSDLIILPQKDFDAGSYIAEIKFQKDPTVVRANLHVIENPVADGE